LRWRYREGRREGRGDGDEGVERVGGVDAGEIFFPFPLVFLVCLHGEVILGRGAGGFVVMSGFMDSHEGRKGLLEGRVEHRP
jgi:hypothetical protein